MERCKNMVTVHGESSSKNGPCIVLFLAAATGESLKYAVVLTVKATNNEVDYESLIIDLELAKGFGIILLRVKCDFQLVILRSRMNISQKDKREEIAKYSARADHGNQELLN